MLLEIPKHISVSLSYFDLFIQPTNSWTESCSCINDTISVLTVRSHSKHSSFSSASSNSFSSSDGLSSAALTNFTNKDRTQDLLKTVPSIVSSSTSSLSSSLSEVSSPGAVAIYYNILATPVYFLSSCLPMAAALSRFISYSISSRLNPLGRYLSTGNHQRISSLDVNIINRGQFNVLKGGSGSHSLICIPGALGTAITDYQYQLEYFSRPDSGFNIVAFDPLGYGCNRPQRRQFHTKPIHFLQQDGIDAHDIMEAMGPTKPFSVLGWSDGGVAALFLSALYPSSVNKLVIWGANAFLTKQDIEMFEKTRDIKKWSPRMRDSLHAIYGNDLPQLWSEWLDSMIHVFNEQNGDLCMMELDKIKTPTLILHGDKDPLVPDVHPSYLNDTINDARLHVFPNGKHNIHIKYSQEFNKIVEEFLLQK